VPGRSSGLLPHSIALNRFRGGASCGRPTRRPLQPEATGAVMEETKWLKPSVSVSRIGDSASVQAVTPVNAEQASKRTMRRPTRQPFRGRLIRLGEAERKPDWISDVLFADRNHNRRPSVVLFKLTQYPLPQP